MTGAAVSGVSQAPPWPSLASLPRLTPFGTVTPDIAWRGDRLPLLAVPVTHEQVGSVGSADRPGVCGAAGGHSLQIRRRVGRYDPPPWRGRGLRARGGKGDGGASGERGGHGRSQHTLQFTHSPCDIPVVTAPDAQHNWGNQPDTAKDPLTSSRLPVCAQCRKIRVAGAGAADSRAVAIYAAREATLRSAERSFIQNGGWFTVPGSRFTSRPRRPGTAGS